MCPDIETFAPLIQATFGTGDESDLRVRLADRSLRQTNPVLGVAARLLELAGERLTASQVLDLAGREPVRRRFGFDDDKLGRIEEWVRASGIRWGLDAAHRAPFKLDVLPSGTWRTGLDRLLLGVAMTEEEQRRFERVLPLDDVESGDIDLAGRLAELIDRLQAAVDAFNAAEADRRVGRGAGRGRRRPHRLAAARRLAARRAAATARRRGRPRPPATPPTWRSRRSAPCWPTG